jgi:hypothetical protein
LSTQSRTRELARLRQIRKRARDTERRSIRVEAEARRIEADATRAEHIGETLAPAVMREPVRAPNGHMLLGARVSIVNGRPVRSLLNMATMRITERLARAAKMFRQDWEEVGVGVGVAAVDYLRSGGSGGSGQGGHAAIVAQLAVRTRLEGAFTHVGAFAPSLARVVLDCVPVSVWATETGKTQEDAMAWVKASLDRLAGWYFPVVPEHPTTQKYPTFGPSRASYEVAEPTRR